ncbi:esterase/lipase superfamily enzyme [Rhizobium mongolense]
MGKQHPQFTLFVSRDDKALAFSRRVWGDVFRLGAIDPEQAPYKKELEDNEIMVIDLTKIKSGDSMNHGKFAESPQIVQLIGQRISEGQTLTDSHVGLGDQILVATTGAATTAGKVAGLVLAARVAVVDQDTRDNYASHVGSVAGTGGARPAAVTVKHCEEGRPTPNCKR